MTTYDHNPNQVPAIADEWTPVLDGELFCSPRCGCGCTKAEYDQACESANALAARMGYRWEVDIWENCGWNYCIKNGPATITPEHDGQYQAEFCFPPLEHAALQIFETDADPRRAFQAAIDRLDTLIVQLSRTRSAIALEPLEISVTANEQRQGDGE